MSDTVTYDRDGQVAVIGIDDGKANVITHDVLGAIHEGLDRAELDARAVVLSGRPRYLSGGFDLAEMGAGAARARDLVIAGGRLHTRLFTYPRPVVIAATGHAVAAGAIMLLVGDWNVGEQGDARIGLPETAIGMPLPRFAVVYAQHRLARDQVGPATLFGQMYDPPGARRAGYLDDVVPAGGSRDAALARAQQLASTVDTAAFALTKERAHARIAADVLSDLEADVASLTTG